MAMKMSERPLWMDVSSYQSFLDMDKAKAAGNDVLGVIMRAGVGLNKDVDFLAFWDYYQDKVAWQSSYWANYPAYSWSNQVIKWFEQNPDLILNIPRLLDAERTSNKSPDIVAGHIVNISNDVLAREGQRPMMYGGYYFLMDNLIPFVSEDWLNEHWWIIASYGDGDADEDDGYSMLIPDKIDPDRVVFQQTTATAELYPGSGHVDRLRFLLGDIEEMRDWARQFSGGQVDPVEPVEPELPVDWWWKSQVDENIELLQEQINVLTLTNEQLCDTIDSLQTAFRAHSTRQGIWKRAVTVEIDDLEGKSHTHQSWRERFFRGR